ncbi:hypothetical protein J5J86_13655 [Aquabacter sp. L1I39]|uniref:hypothetical protein n=1 Tax=Aquabacter sp. L1I39 TaxID=2820278 RepID=UPI001AD9C28B|nr:hypothetical protein [Aquabacter sp. L1I39]QTL01853.1 hypothetical protein J5J86_13655 [Aquabacter sp. L1I39]
MSQLPDDFREIRLELAREKDHPQGARDFGYSFVAPLDESGRIEPTLWTKHRDACRVVRFRPSEADEIGHLVRRPGGSWAFHYDVSGTDDDEAGYRFGDERFTVGEYVSIREDEQMHTYRVVSVEPV